MSVIFVSTHFPKIRLGYTTNTQGFSREAFAKFNLSEQVGDDPKAVKDNRQLFSSYLNKLDIKWLNQQHTNVVSYFDIYNGEPSDAIYTDKPNQICIALTADCLPILLFDKKRSKVAAVHAGWRGLANGVLEATLKEFVGYDLVAWFGPCITNKYFEVGQDVYDIYVDKHEDYKYAFKSIGDNKYLFDMKLVAKDILMKNHCLDVIDSGLCTYSDKRLYSFRRDNVTGRLASFIWFEE